MPRCARSQRRHEGKRIQHTMTKPRAHLLHIGKTGGTAVQNALAPHLHDGKYEIVLEPHRTTLADVPEGEAVLFVLRHPVERFISGFNDRQRRGLPSYFSMWSQDEAEALACFLTANELAESLSDPDERWRQQAQRAMCSIQHVRESFWYWLHDPATFASRRDDVIFVGFQETLTTDFQRLLRVLALDPAITLPTDPAGANLAPGLSDACLSDTCLSEVGRRNILAHYASDVAFYETMRTTACTHRVDAA